MTDWTIERVSQIVALLEDAKKAAKTAKFLALAAITASVINLVCVVIARVVG